MGDEWAAPVHAMDQEDIHASQGLSCADCHGGDPTSDDPDVAMSRARGFRGVPGPRRIPDFCGRCHADPKVMRQYSVSLPTDQLEKYWTSQHGIALKTGDDKVAVCTSCHGTHTIYTAKNPKSSVWASNVPETCNHCHGNAQLMAQYKLPSNVYEGYAQGVHGKALLQDKDMGAPACNDCHGNHGAIPPGVESVAAVCGSCHLNNAELFRASPHKPAFDEMGESECVVCHSNHLIKPPTDDMLGVTGDGVCGQCHSPGDKGYQEAVIIQTFIDSLRTQDDIASRLVAEAARKGIEVSDAEFALKDARQNLIESRTMIHTFNAQKVKESVEKGLEITGKALEMGRKGLADFEFRKWGWGISTVIITLLIIALWLKLRQIERR